MTSGVACLSGQGSSLTPAISSTAFATPLSQMAPQIQTRGMSPLRVRQSTDSNRLFSNAEGSQMSNLMGGLENKPGRGVSFVTPNSTVVRPVRESSPERQTNHTPFRESRYQNSSADMLPVRATNKDSSNASSSAVIAFAAPAAQERVRHNRASAPPPSVASQRDAVMRTSRLSGSMRAACTPVSQLPAMQQSGAVMPSVTTCPTPSPAESAASKRNSEGSVMSFSLAGGSSADVAAGLQVAPERQAGQQVVVAQSVEMSKATEFEEVPDVLRQHLDRRKAQLHSMQQRLAKLSNECDSLQGMMADESISDNTPAPYMPT